jgi:hypothetical protein
MTCILETLTIHELNKRRNDLLKQIEKINKLINNFSNSNIEKIDSESHHVDSNIEKIDSESCVLDSNIEKIDSESRVLDSNIEKIDSNTISDIHISDNPINRIKINIKKIKSSNEESESIIVKSTIRRIKIKK